MVEQHKLLQQISAELCFGIFLCGVLTQKSLKDKSCLKFEVLTAVKISVVVFWVVLPRAVHNEGDGRTFL
jgi:hypothetical protein